MITLQDVERRARMRRRSLNRRRMPASRARLSVRKLWTTDPGA